MKIFFFLLAIVVILSACDELDTNLPPSGVEVTVKGSLDKRHLDDTITFEWTPSVDPEGSAITYSLYISDTEIAGEITELFHSISANDFTVGNNYTGTVIARDDAGNETKSNFDFTTNRPSRFTISEKYNGYTAKHIVWTKATLPDTTNLWYDIFVNDKFLKSQKDTSILLHRNDLAGFSAERFFGIAVVAKSRHPFTNIAYKSYYFHSDLLITSAQLEMNIYNISDKSISVFLTRRLTEDQSLTYRYSIPHRLYINGALQFSAFCAFSPRYYPAVTGLAPNTTYTARYQFSYPDSFDPKYEQTSKDVYIEKTFSTGATPITSQFDHLEVKNVTSTSVEFSWRIKVPDESCYVPDGSAFFIYVNGVHWGTLPHTSTSVVLEKLTPNSSYTLKIRYLPYPKDPTMMLPTDSNEINFTTH